MLNLCGSKNDDNEARAGGDFKAKLLGDVVGEGEN